MLPSISTFEPGQHDWFKEQSTLAIKRVDGCSFHPTAYVVHNDGWRCLYNEILLIKSTWMSFRSNQRWQVKLLQIVIGKVNPSKQEPRPKKVCTQ